MGQWLSERFGQQFVIENRPGAGTNLATEAVVRAAPDGYTLLAVSPANAINATLYEKLNFNFIRDIAPVAGIMRTPNVMVVNSSVPAKSVPEFIAYAKANPGKISFASAGNGSGSHMSGELFKMMTGVDMVHVPYRGGGPALTDLLGGQVQLMFPRHDRVNWVYQGRRTARAWQSPLRRARRCCRTSRPSAISCRATSRVWWMALAFQGTRRRRSSIGSTKRSMRASPIPN